MYLNKDDMKYKRDIWFRVRGLGWSVWGGVGKSLGLVVVLGNGGGKFFSYMKMFLF